ncbi:MAG: HPr family phosphocarrier protein [Chlamydiales bacterium]|nr:HPr family phosphocarrier protein [Chlamydiales bacterium]
MKIEKQLKVTSALGLHARPAAYIARILQQKRSQVMFSYKKETINARSIMGILVLSAHKNALIDVLVEGDDAEETMHALEQAFANQFEDR